MMLIAILSGARPAAAQQLPVQQQPGQQATAPSAQAFPQSAEWANLPKMVLERQYSGPLQDTVIQRLRDPVDGTICYLYLPISAPHSPTTASGFVQYGPNGIGSINCTVPAASPRPAVPTGPGRKP